MKWTCGIAMSLVAVAGLGLSPVSFAEDAPGDWAGDLSPIAESDWNYARAAHLLERAGFGGTPEEIERLAAMTPQAAVDYLVDYESIDVSHLPEFEESNIYPNGHKFMSIQEAAKGAFVTGKAFGKSAKQEGDLPFQPGINEFYTLLWSDYLEIARAGAVVGRADGDYATSVSRTDDVVLARSFRNEPGQSAPASHDAQSHRHVAGECHG